MATNYSDTEIKEMLQKLNRKRKAYNDRRGYGSKTARDLFAHSGLFEDGKVVGVKRFKEMFEDRINYGVKMVENMLDKNYVRDVTKRFKDNLVTLLNNMGLEEESKKVEEMGIKRFTELEEVGTWDYVIEQYESEDYRALMEADIISGVEENKSTKEEITKDIAEYLGWL